MATSDKSRSDFYCTPLRYPGGKTRLYKVIMKVISSNFGDSSKVTLVEPYAGGAGASLKLLFNGSVNKIIINDFDKAIYSFWKIATTDAPFLINKLKNVNVNIDEWNKQRFIYKDRSSNIHDLAFATLYLNRTNRSGIMSGGPIGGNQQIGKWKMDARFNKESIIKKLEKIYSFQGRIKVRNLDGIKLLRNLESSRNNKNYFIFIDPPYYQKGNLLYLNHYGEKDHRLLSKFLKGTDLKWILTYDDVIFIKDLYSGMRKFTFQINHSAYKAKTGKEILILANSLLNKMELISL